MVEERGKVTSEDGQAPVVKALLFDAEGVVVDTESIWDAAQRELLARRGRVYDRDRTKRHLTGRSSAEGIRIIAEHYDLDEDPDLLAGERLELVHRLAGEVRFMPGFTAFYAAVRARYRTALATSMDPSLFESVERQLNLRRLFDQQVFLLSGSVRAKPHPDLFLRAASGLHVDPGRCVVFEDSPHGVEAAHRAGMLCVGMATTYGPEVLAAADLVVSSFEQLDPRSFLARIPATQSLRRN